MHIASSKTGDRQFNEKLEHSGFRLTPQRQQVYQILRQQRDHPTAETVFIRAKQVMPEISMATVYNCLDALVKSGVVKQVNVDRAATRYCPNMMEHVHFHCETCGGIFDMEMGALHDAGQAGIKVPRGFSVKHFDVSLRGLCPECSTGRKR